MAAPLPYELHAIDYSPHCLRTEISIREINNKLNHPRPLTPIYIAERKQIAYIKHSNT